MADKLDKAIADIGYIMDSLLALKRIHDTGNCNICAIAKVCPARPKWGETVRYNCYFFKAREEQNAD